MKYKLTDNKKEFYGRTLFQIEATASFGSVDKGELGGWIESEKNLSQEGDAWVYGKLKLLAGYFFGTRYDKEEIKYHPINENTELIYKGDAKFGEDMDEETERAIKLLKEKGNYIQSYPS